MEIALEEILRVVVGSWVEAVEGVLGSLVVFLVDGSTGDRVVRESTTLSENCLAWLPSELLAVHE